MIDRGEVSAIMTLSGAFSQWWLHVARSRNAARCSWIGKTIIADLQQRARRAEFHRQQHGVEQVEGMQR
jgi:hypothetical protein